MKIGPVDIRNHAFSRYKLRGLDEAEVRAYMELTADRLEESILETDDLRTRIDRVEEEVGEYRQLEKALRDSLLSAERISDGRLEHAEREARIILKDAEVQGEKLIASAREEASAVRAMLDDLRRQRLTYVERFRALLRSQMKILEASVESFDPELNDVEDTVDRIEKASRSGAATSASTYTPTPPTAPPSPAPNWQSAADPSESLQPTHAPQPPHSAYLGEQGLFSRPEESRREED